MATAVGRVPAGPVNEGHNAGADNVKARLRDAAELGVEELTVYSFSTENWSRPPEEVQGLMEMFAKRIPVKPRSCTARVCACASSAGVRGWSRSYKGTCARRKSSPKPIRASRSSLRSTTVDVPRSSTRRVRSEGGGEEEFRRYLYAPEMHDPDIIIRTSGERRLSNYLLWQSAYSELIFRDELWPDFSREALEQSLSEFSERRRRFGGR